MSLDLTASRIAEPVSGIETASDIDTEASVSPKLSPLQEKAYATVDTSSATFHQLVDHCVAIIRNQFERGNSGNSPMAIHIDDVPHFRSAEELHGELIKLSHEHLQYIHGIFTNNRKGFPRPAALGGPRPDLTPKPKK